MAWYIYHRWYHTIPFWYYSISCTATWYHAFPPYGRPSQSGGSGPAAPARHTTRVTCHTSAMARQTTRFRQTSWWWSQEWDEGCATSAPEPVTSHMDLTSTLTDLKDFRETHWDQMNVNHVRLEQTVIGVVNGASILRDSESQNIILYITTWPKTWKVCALCSTSLRWCLWRLLCVATASLIRVLFEEANNPS